MMSNETSIPLRAVVIVFLRLLVRWEFILLYIALPVYLFRWTDTDISDIATQVPFGQALFKILESRVFFFLLLVVGVLLLIRAFLLIRSFRYTLDSDNIHISSGVFKRRSLTIPRSRIQQVIVKRGIIPRLLCLSIVKIYAAGLNISHSYQTGRSARSRREYWGGIEVGELPGVSSKDVEDIQHSIFPAQ